MTKGIILSGGWGTRLRPLTCTIPKTLMPVVNKPVIERQMLLLKNAGIKEIVLAVSVMADSLKTYFKEGEKLGLKLYYTDEKNPMGTAGAIKLAEDYLKDDNFFMLNGDVILNFDFGEMLNYHKVHKGIGTISSRIVSDPTRYGVLIVDDKSSKILQFLEKNEYSPPNGNFQKMLINAGVYLLEPEIFSYIEPDKNLSIETEVFPTVAGEEKLYHYPISGIWKDIGTPEELLEGNILLMNHLLKNLKEENLINESVKFEGKVKIFPPCTIGEHTVIRNGCVVGPNAIIGDNVYVDQNTKISNSLIYGETYISKNVNIERAIISDNCHIRDNVKIKGNEQNLVIIASYVQILENITLSASNNTSISICHHEIIKESLD